MRWFTRWFSFWWSVYDPDPMNYGYWLGVLLYWRWPWEHIENGEKFPHGFRIETGFLDYRQAEYLMYRELE